MAMAASPAASPDPAIIAKDLLRTGRHGALATLMAGSGAPYSSLVAIASAPDGAPLLLISRLAIHTRNIEADRRVSLLLAEPSQGDPLVSARIMLNGTAERLQGSALAVARRRYLAAHPSAEAFVGFADFSFFRISPEALHLVAGFGRIVDLKPDQFLTDLRGAEALLQAEADIVEHLNTDHLDTLSLYATRLAQAEAGPWRCIACDPDGLDLQAGDKRCRVHFPEPVAAPGPLRGTLKSLADFARQHEASQNN